MTIKMRLDTDSLRALIKDNPELEIQIGQEVMNNITREQIGEKIKAQIDIGVKGLLKQTQSWPAKYELKDPDVIKAIRAEIEEFTKKELRTMVAESVQLMVAGEIRKQREALQLEMKGALSVLLTPEIAKEIMREKLLA